MCNVVNKNEHFIRKEEMYRSSNSIDTSSAEMSGHASMVADAVENVSPYIYTSYFSL